MTTEGSDTDDADIANPDLSGQLAAQNPGHLLEFLPAGKRIPEDFPFDRFTGLRDPLAGCMRLFI